MSDNNNVTFYIYILFVLFHLHSYTTGLPCNQKKTATSKGQRSKCRKRKCSRSVSDESSGEEWQPWKEEEERRRRRRGGEGVRGRQLVRRKERGTEGWREGEREEEREGEREEEREGEREVERDRR